MIKEIKYQRTFSKLKSILNNLVIQDYGFIIYYYDADAIRRHQFLSLFHIRITDREICIRVSEFKRIGVGLSTEYIINLYV